LPETGTAEGFLKNVRATTPTSSEEGATLSATSWGAGTSDSGAKRTPFFSPFGTNAFRLGASDIL
jgi:hypothetical protein